MYTSPRMKEDEDKEGKKEEVGGGDNRRGRSLVIESRRGKIGARRGGAGRGSDEGTGGEARLVGSLVRAGQPLTRLPARPAPCKGRRTGQDGTRAGCQASQLRSLAALTRERRARLGYLTHRRSA